MQIETKFFNEFPVLKTERLSLKQILPQHAQRIFEMRTNQRVNQFIARPEMPSLEEAKKLVERTQMAYQNKMGIGWAGFLRDNEQLIGTCGFNSIDYPNLRAEIGGELTTEYWGKNIAYEAVSAIVNFGFDEFQLHSIEAKVSPENRGAIYLLESLGFEKEAHFKDRIYFNQKFQDLAVYTCFRRE